jgi:DNA end-binding protein Ku
MKSIWNPTFIVAGLEVKVHFVLCSIPSKPSAKLIDIRDKSPIKFLKVNSLNNEPVDPQFIYKAYEHEGNLIPVSPEELNDLKPSPSNQIIFNRFIDPVDISFHRIENSWFCFPQKDDEANYKLLLDALKESDSYGLGEAVFYGHNTLFALGFYDDLLMVHKLKFNEQLIAPERLNLPPVVSPAVYETLITYIFSNRILFDSFVYSNQFNEKLNTKLKN